MTRWRLQGGHLRSGTITYDHLRSIDRAIRFIPESRQAEAVALLTDLAVAAPVADVRTAGKHLRLIADPDGTLADCEKQFERRHLTLAPLLDGMTSIDGLLDAESAALLNAALEPFLVPTGPEDVRTGAQRRADGLTDIVRTACDHRLLPMVGGERPHLQVLLAGGALNVSGQQRAGTGPRRPLQLGPGQLGPGQLSQTPGGPAFLHPIGVARIACDAQVTSILVDHDGLPMSRAHRTALLVLATTTPGAPRRWLPIPRLLTTSCTHRRPPRASLVGRRGDRRRQRRSPLPIPPPAGARGRLEHRGRRHLAEAQYADRRVR